MKQKKLGCLTTGGLAALFITLIIVGTSYAFTRNKIFSPGELNAQGSGQILGGVTSHADIEVECAACHPAPWDRVTMSARCVDCHRDLLTQLADPSSLHGAVMAELDELNCRECHTEHHGADGSLTKFLESEFPHELVGFSLQAHNRVTWDREFVCDDCHQSDYSNFELAVCTTCHGQIDPAFMDSHLSSFGNACWECHDGIESYGADFDHDQLAFQLDYLHSNLECEQCHPGAATLQMLRDTPQACEACHQKDDVHEEQMGNQCGVCHSPKGWKFAVFDHSTTGFLLVGGHDKQECLNCHQDKTYQGNDPACISCHLQDEPHAGQFGVDCAGCHTVTGWGEIIFNHSGVIAQDCNACHLVEKPANHFPGQCSACHSTNAWKPATFNHSAAGATDCISCHSLKKPNNHFSGQCSACHSTNAWKPATFNHSAAGATDCISCHSSKKPNNHFSGQCSACHRTNAWKPATFNHSAAGATDCISCHSSKKPNNHFSGQCSACHSTNAWKPATFNHSAAGATDCISCHSSNKPNNHFSGQCSQCHSTNAWKPASFKHSFPLNHGGANQQCQLCHTNNNYNAYTCYGCHEHTPAKMQDKHKEVNNFSNNCINCHANGKGGD